MEISVNKSGFRRGENIMIMMTSAAAAVYASVAATISCLGTKLTSNLKIALVTKKSLKTAQNGSKRPKLEVAAMICLMMKSSWLARGGN